MKIFLLILTSIFLSACNPLENNDKEVVVNDLSIINLTYSHLDGLSGDVFKFDVVTKTNLNNFYQREKYKYSHLKCDGVQGYLVVGSVAIDEGRIENGEYISSGYFKVCEDESMNTCLEKKQVENFLIKDVSCKIVLGGLLQKSKIVADNIIISKNSIIKAGKEG
ncbi:hypothetical protein MMP71_02510 [Acinetobacter dispersus]|uniref:hypothetical protein n=1 Tax=Acinetobacter dispersus TaxID=70348 RepID=UPI00132EEADA|nr:hypothetical protein [Acinetobacter dispersus]MCH7382709.1 hypothetical protein [Acinetobacter dispersus]QHH96493.1 hypothetical protein FPL17_02655 [Acinetobacter dispersus]